MRAFYNIVKYREVAPRWMIFLVDLIICDLSLFYANLLRFNFDFSQIWQFQIHVQLIAVTIGNIIFFRLFKTYSGIIRMSSAQEAFRPVKALFFTFLAILMINFIRAGYGTNHIIPNSILIIYFFTSSFIIFGYRVLAKDLYQRSINARVSFENVLILGGAMNGSLLKRTLEGIEDPKYRVMGFIETHRKLFGKTFDNVPIGSFEDIKDLSKNWNIKAVFISGEEADLEMKNEVVDYYLSQGVAVKTIPPIQNWINGELHVRQIKDIRIEDLLNRPTIQLPTDHVVNYLSNKRILITGAAGSIGSEIVRQLAAINPELLLLCDQSESGLYELEYELEQSCKTDRCKVIIGDITEQDKMKHLFATYRPQVVFHAAAYKHVPMMEKNPAEAVKNNVLGTRIVADLAREYAVERFLFVSTDKAINPTSVMGASKRVAELYIKGLQSKIHKLVVDKSGKTVEGKENVESLLPATKFITTRFGNVLGSSGSVIPRFKEQIEKGGPVTVTHPDIIRYFMTIPEACSLVLEACVMGNGGEIFVFDMGEPVKITDLATKMIKLSGYEPGKEIKIEFTGLRPGEKLFEEILKNEDEIMPTHHKKILISKSSYVSYELVRDSVEQLVVLARQNRTYEVVKQMKQLVPEYKSNNSEFVELDKDVVQNVI
ncbi:MAG: polysaccharide biosynthesis protein [Flavisolibacter sp.]